MTAVWLFDFMKEGSLESFFSTYHHALLQSDPNLDSDRWFYVTEGLSADFSLEEVDVASARLLVDRDGHARYIPSWNNRSKYLNIIFVGDVTDAITQKNLLNCAKLLLEKRNEVFASLAVRFYALLWRPTSATLAPGMSDKAVAFVRELDEMMAKKESGRFHKVLFFESPDLAVEKAKAFASMELAALHIATHDDLGEGDEICRADRNILYNAGSAGVFYEKQVQNEQETFFLSNLLLGTLAHGGTGFVNPTAATAFLDKQDSFFDTFAPGFIAAEIKDGCQLVPSNRESYSVDCEVSPFSLKFKAVWKKYYNEYLVNLKANLINKTKKVLMEFAQNYKEAIYAAQTSFVNKVKDDLEAKVFEIFKNPEDFDAVSIPQALDILGKMRKRIAEKAKEIEVAKISSFVFPKYLEGAREQVEAEIQSEDPSQVIAVLESKLKRHPVYLLSMFVRAIVLGALLCYTGITFIFANMSEPVLWVIGTLLFLLPLVISAWSFREYMVRINSLKDQYVACVLLKYKKELDADLKKCVLKTYSDLDQYCEWLKVRKLEFLQSNLAAVSPPEFSFTPSPRFQPLMTCMPYGASSEGKLLIPAMKVDVNSESQMSGTFGKYPILDNPPVSKVKVNGLGYSFEEILRDNTQNLLRTLIKGLLKSTAAAKGNVEQNVEFESIRTPRTKLLLLDVSGSMSDSDMAELKVAVEKLSHTATVKWIAFNDKVVAYGDSAESFNKINSGGGTNYIPVILKAKEVIDAEVVDQVILISDGMPSESVNDILNEAYKLAQPIHTISIGNSGASVMKQISDMTSGEQIIVNDIKELSVDVESKFNVIFSLGLSGEYTFAELMQKVYIPGCAEALHKFASASMETAVSTIADLIAGYINKRGLREWADVSDVTCTHATAVAARELETINYIQMVCKSEKDAVKVQETFSEQFRFATMSVMENVPEMMVSVLTMRPLSKITDLQWANYKGVNK